MKLSILIVNFNGKHFLDDCLESIRLNVKVPYEVIMVDNASVDGSAEYVRQNYPDVKLLASERNLGFSAGNNLGAKEAKGEILLLLNSDTRILSSLFPAIKEFETNSLLGALGCRIYYGDGRFQPSIGFEITPLRVVLSWSVPGGFSFVPNIFKRVDGNEKHYAFSQDVAWVSGAFLITRRGLWEALGGFDERYFMYMEDVDYCRKVREADYRVAYAPLVKIIHYEGGGKAWIGDKALNDSMRSYIIYMKKFHNHSVFFMRAGLGMVMAARMFAYGIASFFLGSQVYKEKKKGYYKAVRILIGIEDIG